MTIEAANVSWITLVMSSAVTSAVVNVGWNAWQKHGERKREDEKDSKRVGHIYLDLSLQLESFAKRCDTYLYDIDNGLWERSKNHDESELQKLRSITFKFEPEPNWIELPIAFTAALKVLPKQFENAHDWIKEQWNHWADLEDAYSLEQERVAYYGLKACEVAASIRAQIQAGDGDTDSSTAHFQSLIEERRQRFQRDGNEITLTPDLQALFTKENLSK